jgi:competence protein ComEC
MKFKYLLVFLVFLTIFIWMVVLSFPDNKLKIIACDVGQGDAVLVTYKNFQVLTDGGPNTKVLDCLSKYVPFWDRKIDVVILTNADLDHYGGLIEVFKRYKVGKFIQNPVKDSTQSYKVLEDLVGSSHIDTIVAQSGQTISYDLIYLDILYPEDDAQSLKTNSQNNLSTVYRLNFNNFKAIFTGDIEEEASDYIANNITVGDVDYIKIPHHGSRNGLTKTLLEAVKPEIAVISAGKNNKYGHPHKEIVEMLKEHNVLFFTTSEVGDIKVTVEPSGKYFY